MQFQSSLSALPIINAVGYSTRVGGSKPLPDALEAMRWAQEHYFEIDDLLAHASEVIARETGAEAGLVTCGASAALTLGAAAILARNDVEIMEALPDVSNLARHQFLYPVRGRYDYDHPIRLSGAKLVEFSFGDDALEERLRAAFTHEVAGVVHVWKHREDTALIRRIATVCREAGMPFLLDGAMSLPPAENLRDLAGLGADLVALSGGKHLGGPQNSGILFGRRDLVTSAWLQMVDMDVRANSWSLAGLIERGFVPEPPRNGVGRGFKVGKDVIAGCLAALENYSRRDFAAERKGWHDTCAAIVAAVKPERGFKLDHLPENGTGQFPVVRIEAETPSLMEALKRHLKQRSPKIILAEDDEKPEIAYVYPMCLERPEVGALSSRLSAAMNHEIRSSSPS